MELRKIPITDTMYAFSHMHVSDKLYLITVILWRDLARYTASMYYNQSLVNVVVTNISHHN